ncbi:MAG: hypothetical protein ABSA63_09225 [Thermoplasmata archaeon]|jgi:hypothetical protein
MTDRIASSSAPPERTHRAAMRSGGRSKYALSTSPSSGGTTSGFGNKGSPPGSGTNRRGRPDPAADDKRPQPLPPA